MIIALRWGCKSHQRKVSNMSGIATAVIGGAVISSMAAGDAADAQSASASQSDATQRYMYDTTRADNAPFRETGLAANNQLADLMNSGQFGRRFTQADLNADPVYQNGLQFGLNEGTKGINRQAAAGGSMLSGATLKALTRFGNDYGSTKANESYNRFNNDQNSQYNKLAGLSGAGQQATNQISASGQNMANNISASQIGAGNARASGYVGQANAWTGAIGQGLNAYQQSNMLNRIFPTAGYSGATGYTGGSDPMGDFISSNGW
ncbi:hypothetical protein [Acidovorax sp.]|uniref:hypothetical protein n=1 Tax=Acidovorax sp. TaxID=1872122 RepID=UPI0026058255|nr:hypothetical protein [Acidovorax sp.]HQT19417.1 hypothetical protein [Acidovorax defluvii]